MKPQPNLRRLAQSLLGAFSLACAAVPVQAADPPAGVVGRNGWLFYRYEVSDASLAADANLSVQLIARLARVFARNDVALAVTLVPLKMRIYAEHLPPDLKLTPQLAGQYDRLARTMREGKVHFIDLNASFMASPKRAGDNPLFMRLDTHWSPTGALVAAEAIRAGIDANPALRQAFESTPEAKYELAWAPRKVTTPANDLVAQLPKGAADPGKEQVLAFAVKREKAVAAGVLGSAADPAITLMGSSYAADWTQFPDALRHALQRDVLSISVPANQGSWVGLESYLSDDAFQTVKPRLIVWELPERDMIAPPDFKYREARYRIDNTEWLLRAAAWIEAGCAPSGVAVKSVGGKLGAGAGPSKDGDFLELTFDRPLDRLEYLSARLVSDGSSMLTLEATRSGAPSRRFTIAVAGDDAPHAFRTPLYAASGKGFDRVRIHPGKANRFSLEDVKVCRNASDLLADDGRGSAGR